MHKDDEIQACPDLFDALDELKKASEDVFMARSASDPVAEEKSLSFLQAAINLEFARRHVRHMLAQNRKDKTPKPD